jgi:hypothetical protein
VIADRPFVANTASNPREIAGLSHFYDRRSFIENGADWTRIRKVTDLDDRKWSVQQHFSCVIRMRSRAEEMIQSSS